MAVDFRKAVMISDIGGSKVEIKESTDEREPLNLSGELVSWM